MPRGSLLVSVFALVFALCGCASSEPPTPPLSPDSYTSSWLVVVVEPATSIGRSQQQQALGQITDALDGEGQAYTLYTAPGRDAPGISADSIYLRDTATPTINPEKVRRIATEEGATSVFVVEPEEILNLKETNPATGERYDIKMDRGDGTAIDVAVYLDRDAAATTRASLYHGADMDLTWRSVRITKDVLYQRVRGSLDIVGYNARALTLEALTGRALIASDFIFNVDTSVLVYPYGRSTIYGTGAYVDGSNLVVSQEDGQVTVPLYMVSQVKERTSRDKVFPTAPTIE